MRKKTSVPNATKLTVLLSDLMLTETTVSHVQMKTVNLVIWPTNVMHAWMEMSPKTRIWTTATPAPMITVDSAIATPNVQNVTILMEPELRLMKI